MSVWYLELDDEITDAVARLRAARDERVVFVVPPGSRIGTGRINFRLLAREAEQRDLSIALVSGDAQVRALAAAAGLPAFATVAASEAPEWDAVSRDVDADGGLRGTAVVGVVGGAAAAVIPTTTSNAPGPAGFGSSVALPGARTGRTDTGAGGAHPSATGATSRGRRAARVGISLGLAGVLVGSAMYGAYVTIPSATVALELAAWPVSGGPYTIIVDPDEETDAASGRVQAQALTIPLRAEGTFTSSGRGGSQTSASGAVDITSLNDISSVSVESGSEVSTPEGIRFRIITSVSIGAATDGPVTVSVPIQAVNPGAEGNVAAGTITEIVSSPLQDALRGGGITNQEPTSGGGERIRIVSEADYEAAVAKLTADLEAQLAARASSPDDLPATSVAIAATAELGAVTPDAESADVVELPVEQFPLAATATATVLAVDIATFGDVAKVQLAADLVAQQPPRSLDTDHATVRWGFPTIADGVAVYRPTVSGAAYDRVDPAELLDRIKGKSIPEAQAILDDHGTPSIVMSPDFLPLPDDASRIDLTVTPPQAASVNMHTASLLPADRSMSVVSPSRHVWGSR